MILYFSATGNDKYVALRLQEATQDTVVSLRDVYRKNIHKLTIKEKENFGVIMPTYWEGLPVILLDYLKETEIKVEGKEHYFYFIATYGCDYGNILSQAQKIFQSKGIVFDSLYAARFVDNWSPYFYLKDERKNHEAEENGRRETEEIVQCVLRKEKGHTLPDQMTPFQAKEARREYDILRQTKNFHLDIKRCISCGLCARQCPIGAIEMKDNHPVWVKENCTLCLGCYHRCPANAIEFEGSRKNGQYTNPNVKLDI